MYNRDISREIGYSIDFGAAGKNRDEQEILANDVIHGFFFAQGILRHHLSLINEEHTRLVFI